MGFALVYGVGRFFHAAHATTIAVGLYTAHVLCNQFGLSPCTWIPGAILGAVVTGILVEFLGYRPLRRANAGGLILLVASLSIVVIGDSILAAWFGRVPRTLDAPWIRHSFTVGEATATAVQLSALIGLLLATGALWIVMHRTRVGLYLRATASRSDLASLHGINPEAVSCLAIVAGSVLAGFAAVLVGLDTGFSPSTGFDLLLVGVVACLVAGARVWYGSLAGGLVLAALNQLGVLYIGSEWQSTITFGVLLLILLIRPQGLLEWQAPSTG